MTLPLIERLAIAHVQTGAPGYVVSMFKDGRYVVESRRWGKEPIRRAFRYEVKPNGRVTVKPCWTTEGPDGKAVQHRRSATE